MGDDQGFGMASAGVCKSDRTEHSHEKASFELCSDGHKRKGRDEAERNKTK